MPLHAAIDDALAAVPPGRPVWVALSGGLDSCLLLTLAVQASRRYPHPIYALHVNHGLQTAAGDFEHHCRVLCSRLGVPLYVERVRVDRRGQGLEAAARESRYAAFAQRVGVGDALWLAQHADDQAETLLLAALRGSGVRGLAGMPAQRDWAGRCLMRPLLAFTRGELEREAQARGVAWVNDPSNQDLAIDRNYLRRDILPRLAARWPVASSSLARSATLSGEADTLLDELAALDLEAAGSDAGRLALAYLMTLSPPRQRLLIRHACQRLALPTPPAGRLAALLSQLGAREDAKVAIEWPGGEARRWRGALYLQAPLVPVPENWQAEWNGHAGMRTPAGPVEVSLVPSNARPCRLRLTWRKGGETLRVAGRGRRDVKRLLQDAGIPPWLRDRQLLAWDGDTLVAVLGVAVAEGWEMAAG
ncbi:tRNA lysidine(34) synthetase TilS [Halomonas sp. McH1-25]|uniref:tRNA lysidine(34) synthetase TilS n=1 Tax=unclassified Halomonas TaxID=2609666 RepID=UPI0031B84889